MLTKAWIAILMGLLLGSLLFSSGCGWWGGGYSNDPYYYGTPANCNVPAAGVPATGGTPGWRASTGGATSGPAVVNGAGTVKGATTTSP